MSQIDLQTVFLSRGWHHSPELGMCVMEAVSLYAGELFSDAPECASPRITALLRRYNDALDDEDRQCLVAYIPRLVGTRGSEDVEERRAFMALDWMVRVHFPVWLRFGGFDAEAEALASLPEIISREQVASVEAPLAAALAATAKPIATFYYESDPTFLLWQKWDDAATAVVKTGAEAAEVAAWSPERPWVTPMAQAAQEAARAAAIMGYFKRERENPTPFLHQTIHALIERMIAAQE